MPSLPSLPSDLEGVPLGLLLPSVDAGASAGAANPTPLA